MPRNILVVGVNNKCLNFVVEGRLSVLELKGKLQAQEDVPTDSFYLVRNGIPLDDSYELQDAENSSFVIVRAYPIIKGGKGGFGSLIRAMGMQINKSTNKNACRDLSGRRVRDVKAEKDIAEWVKSEPERRKRKTEEKRKRMEKRRAEPKHYFSDPKYMEQIQNTSEEIQEALKQGMETAATSSKAGKRKNTEPEAEGSVKKAKIWLGMEGLTSESDEDKGDTSEQSSPSSQSEGAGEGEEEGEGDTEQCQEGGGTSCACDGDNVTSGEDGIKLSDGGVTSGDHSNMTSSIVEHSSSGHQTGECSVGTPLPNGQNAAAVNSDSGGHSSTRDAVNHPINTTRAAAVAGLDSTDTCSSVQEGQCPSVDSSSRDVQNPSTSKDDTSGVLCLDTYLSAEDLEVVGAEKLKEALQVLGLKCGGTVKERAQRLFSTKGKTPDQLDRSLFAKPTKSKK